jgi:hypothetical protein
MKKVFLFFVCAAAITTAQAQTKFGIKAGANFASFAGDDADGAKTKVGINAGVFAEVPLASSFSFRPELVFSSQGAKSEEDGDDFKLNSNYINVPLLVKFISTSGFFAETGPQVGILASAKAKSGGVSVNVKDAYKSVDFGWGFGLGYQTPAGIGVNGRYNLGLSNVGDDDNSKLRNSVFQLGVFYTFGSGGVASK